MSRGPNPRLLILVVGILAFLVLGGAVLTSANWPATCDPQDRKFELFRAYACSPELLSGGAHEMAAFIFLWALPVGALALILFRPRKTRVIYKDRVIDVKAKSVEDVG